MKLLVVIPYFYPAYVYGGAVFAAYNLSKETAKLGIDVFVATTNINGPNKLNAKVNTFISVNNLKIKYYKAGLLPFFSRFMIFGLINDIKIADVIHIQSIYSLTTPLALLYSKWLKKPIILSPRGSLTGWSFNHRKRMKLLWIKYLIKPFSNGLYWHATSNREEKEIRFFFPNANIKLIPDGSTYEIEKSPTITHDKNWKKKSYIACLGRLHKVKGYDIMISAMPFILEKIPHLKLVIAGNDEGELTNLKSLTKQLKMEERVEFCGAINGSDKNAFLKHAKCLVVPSHTENFGIVVVEALQQSTPVVASKNTPWEVLQEEKAGLHVKNTPQEISKAVIHILDKQKEYQENTLKVAQLFSWDSIAVVYKKLLQEIKLKNETDRSHH